MGPTLSSLYWLPGCHEEVGFLCPVLCRHVSCAERPRQRSRTEVLKTVSQKTHSRLLFPSVCLCVCAHVCVGTCANTQVYVWKPEANVGSLPLLISALPFGDSLSLNLGLLIWVEVTGSFLIPCSQGLGL